MLNKRSTGMTLVELIITIVIINVGLVGVMLTFINTTNSSADSMILKQTSAIADGLMEEIQLKPFLAAAPTFVNPRPCARDTFNDIRDYNGYTPSAICDIAGTPIAALSGFSVVVAVTEPTANNPMPPIPVFPLAPVPEVLRIDITVRYRGGDPFMLTGWRTCYGGPPC